ncbi:MAG: hypothetical protein JW983_07590 [Elusimicrobia bacterium]|nr:hypothetical protein [Elusimicrobiota bacterium]
MFEELKNIKSGKKELREFGITISIVLGLFGGVFLWKQKESFVYLFIISGIFLFFGLVFPKFLKPVQKIWMGLSVILGWLMTRLILSILFFLVITPVNFLARIFGKRFLETKFDKNTDSYWIPKKSIKFDKKRYENQF